MSRDSTGSFDLTPGWAALPGPPGSPPPSGWRESAACRHADPELFFPIGPVAVTEIREAKAVCAGCRVRQPCLAYSLIAGQRFGIWGGCDEDERRALHRQWQEAHSAAAGERARS